MNELLTLVPSVVAIAVLVGPSAFFSSSESALFSLSADWLASADATAADAAGDVGEPGDAAGASANATVLDALREDPHRLLVTILVGNNLVNIAISSLITLLVVEFVPSGLAVVLATLAASVLILVFGEIVPKPYGLGHAQSWSLRVARPLSFVVTGAQEAMEFDALDIELTAATADGERAWTGDALCLLVGNARRFVAEGGQGDMEDGLFDVAVVERMPAPNVVAEAIGQRLLGRDTPGVTHLQASELHVTAADPIRFSRDGELAEHDGLDLSVRANALVLRVGASYDPDPV